MKNVQKNDRILYVAAAFLLLSILLMIIIIPGVLHDTKPGASPERAVTGISLALMIRLLIFVAYLRIIWQNRRTTRKKKGEYAAIGMLLIFFGLIYMDGAFAFFDHKNIFYVSILMFGSTLCDLVAGILTLIAFFRKPKNAAYGAQP